MRQTKIITFIATPNHETLVESPLLLDEVLIFLDEAFKRARMGTIVSAVFYNAIREYVPQIIMAHYVAVHSYQTR